LAYRQQVLLLPQSVFLCGDGEQIFAGNKTCNPEKRICSGEWHNRPPQVLNFRMRFRDPAQFGIVRAATLAPAARVEASNWIVATDMPGAGGCRGGLNGYI
jgi:hypothetical protein